jgi:hypothetical protein
MWILHKLVYKVWPNFSLEFGGEIGYSQIYAQWHIIVRTGCIHSIQDQPSCLVMIPMDSGRGLMTMVRTWKFVVE